MVEVIKMYTGKLGVVTVTRYVEAGETWYRVKHDALVGANWTKDKREAIIEAQFLAGKY